MDKESLHKITHTKWFLNIVLPGAGVIFATIFFYLIFSKNYFFALLLFAILFFTLFLLFQDYFLKICSKIKMNSVLKTLFWLTIITALTGPAFLTISFGSYHLFPFRFFLPLILFLILLQVLVNYGKLKASLKKIKPYLLFLAVWFAYAIISLSWAQSKIAALQEIFFLFTGFSLIFLIILYLKNLKDLKIFYWLWIILAILLLGIGFWETFTGNHLPSSAYLGRATAYAGKFRPSGFFYNTNDFATFLGLIFPFILAWIHYGKKRFSRFLGIILFGGAFYLLVETGSRANLLALILECFILFFFLLTINKKIKLVLSIVLIVALLFLLFPNFIQQIFNKVNLELSSFGSEYQMTVGSDIMRINLAKNALYYLFYSYGFGVGAGNIETHIADFSPYYTSTLLNLHNWWAEILANYGIFIFCGYLLFYLGLIYNLWKIWHKKLEINEKIICESLLLSLIGFSIASISSSSIMAFNPQWILFGVSLAFLNYYRLKYKKIKI